jgi:hypothetical protein
MPQLSSALLPAAMMSEMPWSLMVERTAASMARDQVPAATPSDKVTTEGPFALAAIHSRPARHDSRIRAAAAAAQGSSCQQVATSSSNSAMHLLAQWTDEGLAEAPMVAGRETPQCFQCMDILPPPRAAPVAAAHATAIS